MGFFFLGGAEVVFYSKWIEGLLRECLIVRVYCLLITSLSFLFLFFFFSNAILGQKI